jgi:SAM-dependent methyltransferase
MEPEYIHGTSATEQERLSLLNRLMNDASLREMHIERGDRIVDFGCGLGQLSLLLAQKAGTRLVGIERSSEQLAKAPRDELLDLRQGSAEQPPLTQDEWGQFDLAHARFVLEHVQDPLAVVKQMVRAVRAGGRIVLQDDDHDVFRAYPEPPGFPELWRSFVRTYDRIGCDPFVGRRLVSLLHEAGAQPVRSSWISFGACAGMEEWPGFIENIRKQLEGAREAIVETGMMGALDFDHALAAFSKWAVRPDAAFWYAICRAEGVRT